jgi:2,5-furandicarboxylate decarboxylase 1
MLNATTTRGCVLTEPQDLRSFLRSAEAHSEPVFHISRPVSPELELSAIVKLLERRSNPIIFFEHVLESTMPVVTGVHGTRERISLALGCTPDQAVNHFLASLDRSLPPRIESTGPVKDVRLGPSELDLWRLPVVTHATRDAGKYLTAAVGLAKDPQTGAVNTGIYRVVVKDRNHLLVAAAGDLATIIDYSSAKGIPLEFVLALGHHPVVQIASQAKIPMSTDSLGLTGALLGEPLAMVRGESVEALVPGWAEIVIEGHFVPGEVEPEGPFGEFPYYYNTYHGYLVEVTAISHRADALFLDIHNVHAEHRCLFIFPSREAQLLAHLHAFLPNVRQVHIPIDSGGMHAFVSIETPVDGQGKKASLVALAADQFLKQVIVVDADVDIFDSDNVLWALATRFQADRDMIVVPYTAGTSMNPSSYTWQDRDVVGELTTQVGLDATIPRSVRFPERADSIADEFAGIALEDYIRDPPFQDGAPWRA